MIRFELKDRDAAGRLGKLTTPHGSVTTPTLLPVINPHKMIITPTEMKSSFDVDMVITNSYIIRKHKELRRKAIEDGVHRLLSFDGPIMTDSGTFQEYVYGSVSVKPVEIIEFQRQIGVDIGTILDVFGTPDQSRKEAVEGVKETVKRAKKSSEFKGDMGLACPVQGSIYPDLRKRCAKQLSAIHADLYPIGGVVPLMEQQRYAELVTIILASKQGLIQGKPVHLFGAGHPLIFPLAVALGCDLFDSSAYVKYAQQNRLIFPHGTLHLEDIHDLPCCCPVCTKISATELRNCDLDQRTRLIARHNLFVSMQEIKLIRQAIRSNTLWQMVERKAAANPGLNDALHTLRKSKTKKWLEQFEPTHKKKAVIYTGPQTIHRPLMYRLMTRLLEWYPPRSQQAIVLPEAEKPYHVHYASIIKKIHGINPDVEIIVDSPIGPAPLVLDEMYPYAQSVFPQNIDHQSKQIMKRFMLRFLKDKTVIYWRDETTLQVLKNVSQPYDAHREDVNRMRAVASMQFGPSAPDILFSGDITFVKSKKTKRIRNVFSGSDHVVSYRASDGLFTLKLAGGKRLHQRVPSPRYRVIVDDDAVSSIKEGKSVFSKFIIDADGLLRPFDECIVVDLHDTFLGVGRCLLNRQEMMEYTYGQAVKMREHISDEN